MKTRTDQRTCHWCERQVGAKEFCPDCTDSFANCRPAHELTPDEREAEMRHLDGPLEIPFQLIHKRIEELVGRPVWTHEMGLNWEGLIKEARWEDRPATMGEIIDLIPEEKRIVI